MPAITLGAMRLVDQPIFARSGQSREYSSTWQRRYPHLHVSTRECQDGHDGDMLEEPLVGLQGAQ